MTSTVFTATRSRALLTLASHLLVVVYACGFAAAGEPALRDTKLTLHSRHRVETATGSGRYHAITDTVEWDAPKTAIVICDMWDKHWCAGATRRVAEMAPRMNELLVKARRQGVLIIHCPSDTLDYYKDSPARLL